MVRRVPTAYLAAVLAVALTRALTGHPSLSSLALTPDRLASGQVWLLLTSALIVSGPVLPQLAALVATLLVAQRRLGAAFVCVLMLVAHVGATLLAYAALAVFTGDADGAHNRSLDYGVSAVWLGALGGLMAAALPAARRRTIAAAALVLIAAVAFFPLLAATEHGFAFALGAAAVLLRERRSAAGRSARSGASTASARAASA